MGGNATRWRVRVRGNALRGRGGYRRRREPRGRRGMRMDDHRQVGLRDRADALDAVRPPTAGALAIRGSCRSVTHAVRYGLTDEARGAFLPWTHARDCGVPPVVPSEVGSPRAGVR